MTTSTPIDLREIKDNGLASTNSRRKGWDRERENQMYSISIKGE